MKSNACHSGNYIDYDVNMHVAMWCVDIEIFKTAKIVWNRNNGIILG